MVQTNVVAAIVCKRIVLRMISLTTLAKTATPAQLTTFQREATHHGSGTYTSSF
jgi:hypothetical protein